MVNSGPEKSTSSSSLASDPVGDPVPPLASLQHLTLGTNNFGAELLKKWRSHNKLTRMLRDEDVHSMAYDHPFVVMVFTDIVGYTNMCNTLNNSRKVMMYLNDLFGLFDVGVQLNKCYKLETVGDAYIVASGLLQSVRSTLYAFSDFLVRRPFVGWRGCFQLTAIAQIACDTLLDLQYCIIRILLCHSVRLMKTCIAVGS
jgi:class 3 adenylate cyclase